MAILRAVVDLGLASGASPQSTEQRALRAARGIAYVPFFPIGGFTPLQSSVLDAAAASLHSTPTQVALAWLLERSSNIPLIPGTSSLKHLRENLQAATLEIPPEVLANVEAMPCQSVELPRH